MSFRGQAKPSVAEVQDHGPGPWKDFRSSATRQNEITYKPISGRLAKSPRIRRSQRGKAVSREFSWKESGRRSSR